MNKEGLTLFIFIVCTLFPVTITAQIRQVKPGVTVATTKRGTGPAFRPKPDSPITRLRYKAPASITLTLHERVIVDGAPPPGYDDCMAKLSLEKDGVFFGEMIPEQETEVHIRLFFNIPPMMKMIDIKPERANVLKLIHFESVLEEQQLSTIPLLLIYEDDPEKGTNEQFVQKYTKEGKLVVDKALNEELLSQLLNYRLIHYNIQYKEN